MIKKCLNCKNRKEVKENGRGIWICTVTKSAVTVWDKVICGYHESIK